MRPRPDHPDLQHSGDRSRLAGFGLRHTTETAPHREPAVGRTRRLEATGPADLTGDPAKPAAVVRETAPPGPTLHLALGTDTCEAGHAGPTEHLTALETQKDLAASVRFTA